MESIDRITKAALFTHFLKQPRGHAAAEDHREKLRGIKVANVIGTAFKADQYLRVHQFAIFAEITANIGGEIKRWRSVVGAETAKTLFNFFHELIVIDAARGRYHHAVGAVLFIDILAQVVRTERHNRIRLTKDGASDWLMAIGGFGKAVKDYIIRRIVRSTDLLHDDLLFALKLRFIELRSGQNI